MVLFLLVPLLLGVALVVSERKQRCRNRSAWGQARWIAPDEGRFLTDSRRKIEVSLGTFSGPLVTVAKRGGKKPFVPDAFFLTASLNGVTRRSTILYSSAATFIDLSQGVGPQPFLLAPMQSNFQLLTLELYGCRLGSFTGKPKKVTLLGSATIDLCQRFASSESMTIPVEFQTPEVAGGRGLKRQVVAPGGAEIGGMELGVRLSPSRGFENARFKYDPLKLNQGIPKGAGLLEGGYVPAAVYGPDGTAWVVEKKEDI